MITRRVAPVNYKSTVGASTSLEMNNYPFDASKDPVQQQSPAQSRHPTRSLLRQAITTEGSAAMRVQSLVAAAALRSTSCHAGHTLYHIWQATLQCGHEFGQSGNKCKGMCVRAE